jgi:hypothetical protein
VITRSRLSAAERAGDGHAEIRNQTEKAYTVFLISCGPATS